jgi:predicted transcriptional regulator
MEKSFKHWERFVRAFSSHWRLQILDVLDDRLELDLTTVARACGLNIKTASAHLRRLSVAGLVLKKPMGTHVIHSITPRGKAVLKFLKSIA